MIRKFVVVVGFSGLAWMDNPASDPYSGGASRNLFTGTYASKQFRPYGFLKIASNDLSNFSAVKGLVKKSWAPF